MKVTREQILEIMPNAKDKVDAFLPYINGYAEVFILIHRIEWHISWLR